MKRYKETIDNVASACFLVPLCVHGVFMVTFERFLSQLTPFCIYAIKLVHFFGYSNLTVAPQDAVLSLVRCRWTSRYSAVLPPDTSLKLLQVTFETNYSATASGSYGVTRSFLSSGLFFPFQTTFHKHNTALLG